MKKLFVLFSIILLLFAFTDINTQQNPETKGFSVCFDLGTIANSTTYTGYLDLRNWKKVDSVGVSISATNETDVDTLNMWVGNWTQDGFVKDAAAGVLYQAVALNIADDASDFINLVTSNATKLTGVALRGANGVYFEVESASSGNDAADPNAAYITFRVYGEQ